MSTRVSVYPLPPKIENRILPRSWNKTPIEKNNCAPAQCTLKDSNAHTRFNAKMHAGLSMACTGETPVRECRVHCYCARVHFASLSHAHSSISTPAFSSTQEQALLSMETLAFIQVWTHAVLHDNTHYQNTSNAIWHNGKLRFSDTNPNTHPGKKCFSGESYRQNAF